jgi:transcriptional regulator with XRE-family HTH domain
MLDPKQRHIVAYSLRMNRVELGFTIESLAEEAGMSSQDVEAIENELCEVDAATVNILADALGLPTWNLMV